MEERRTARRYRLALQVSLKPKSESNQVEPIVGTTPDISTHGFCCRITRALNVGAKFGFAITLPRLGEETAQGVVRGQAVSWQRMGCRHRPGAKRR
jgi:hypothetical protein